MMTRKNSSTRTLVNQSSSPFEARRPTVSPSSPDLLTQLENPIRERAVSPPSPPIRPQPPAKRQRLDLTAGIHLLIGPSNQIFIAPRALLTRTSAFFRAECKGLKHAEDAKLKLPWASPEIFATYLQWMYTGEVVVVDGQGVETESHVEKIEYFKKLMTGLVQSYVLGDKVGDSAFKNGVMDFMMDEYGRLDLLPNAQEITRAYNATSTESILRRALVAMYCYGIEMKWLEDHAAVLPPLFLTDIIKAFANAHDEGETLGCPGRMERCLFHEHGEDVPECW